MISTLLPLTWVLVATVAAPEWGELAAHPLGEYVTIANVASKEAKLYDRRGKYVRTIVGPDAPDLLTYTFACALRSVTMTPDGRLTPLKFSEDYIPRSVRHEPPTLPSEVYQVELRRGGFARCFPLMRHHGPEPVRSWDRDALVSGIYMATVVGTQ